MLLLSDNTIASCLPPVGSRRLLNVFVA